MSVTQASKPGVGGASAVLASACQPGFIVCVVTLAVLTAAYYGATWNIRSRKLPAPLRVPLSRLDQSALAPYRVVNAYMVNPEVLDTLGTDQYIQWTLIDESIRDDQSPVKRVHLFVTYYTGQPDPVPHIPDICYLGAGYLINASEDWNIDIDELGRQVPARLLELAKKGERPIVTYTFGVNGGFAVDRNEVRGIVGQPWEAYAYFSKVEARFDSLSGAAPTRQETRAAVTKLFRKLVPLLVKTHWPDWKALHEKEAPAARPSSVVR